METEVVSTIEQPIHVSFKQVKNTLPAQRYKMLFAGYDFVVSSKGTQGVRVRLTPDATVHKEYEKKAVFTTFWLTPGAMNMYLGFLIASKVNPEMLREEPTGETNPDGTPVTQCVYGVEEQLKSVYGCAVYADVVEEEYEGVAADGTTPEKKWKNDVATRGFSKV